MAVVSSFDQWEKDVFFSAAEEVQESADVMESLYRTWHHGCTSGICSEDLEELERELQAALGTAKWQLEQFQQAIAVSHEKYPSEENTISRRRQFVSAIETQIRSVEMSLANNLTKDGKPSFSWVKLEEGEKDDFVAFLSSDSLSNRKPDRATETTKEAPCKREEEVIIPIEDLSGEQEVAVHNCHKASSIGFLRGSEAQPRIKLLKNSDLRVKDEEITPKPKNPFLNDRDLKGNSFISQIQRAPEELKYATELHKRRQDHSLQLTIEPVNSRHFFASDEHFSYSAISCLRNLIKNCSPSASRSQH